MHRVKSLCLAVLFISCSTATSSDDSIPPTVGEVETSYLFVGNSLSYFNDMPDILTEIAATYDMQIGTHCLCKPNYALLDHWDEPELGQLLSGGAYSHVILQQGPSSQTFGRSVLLEYGPKISDLAKETNTKTAFYMVWPSRAYYSTFDGVIRNYTDAAENADADLFPVGQVWKDYIAQTGDYSIYGGDEFHPSQKGSFLAAWVIFRFLNPELEIDTLPDFSQYISQADFSVINELISIPD